MPIRKKEFEQADTSIHDMIVERIKEHYKKRNFETYTGKKLGRFGADLISVRDQDLAVAVEVKPNDANEIRKGIGQAFSYMNWVHKVYLAVPPESIKLTSQLLNNTPIGILTVINKKVSTVKEADRVDPEPTKLTQLLGKTTGFCWICGRTFNVVPPTQKGALRGEIYIAHRKTESRVFKALEKSLGKRIRTKGGWVRICTVCSRIIGEAIYEYLKRACKGEEFPAFDFREYGLEESKEYLKSD